MEVIRCSEVSQPCRSEGCRQVTGARTWRRPQRFGEEVLLGQGHWKCVVGPCEKHFRHPYPQRMLITRKLRAATSAWVSISCQRDVDDPTVPSLGSIAAALGGRWLSNGLSLFFPSGPWCVIPPLSHFSLPPPQVLQLLLFPSFYNLPLHNLPVIVSRTL